jgi:hypothetical protein
MCSQRSSPSIVPVTLLFFSPTMQPAPFRPLVHVPARNRSLLHARSPAAHHWRSTSGVETITCRLQGTHDSRTCRHGSPWSRPIPSIREGQQKLTRNVLGRSGLAEHAGLAFRSPISRPICLSQNQLPHFPLHMIRCFFALPIFAFAKSTHQLQTT